MCVTNTVRVRTGAALGSVVALTALAATLGTPHPDEPPAPFAEAQIRLDAASVDSTAPSVLAAAPPVARARRTATLVMGGDLLWHNTVWLSAAEDHARTGRGKDYDFDPMFAALRPLVGKADVALCHEEVPFAAPGQAPQNFPVFAAPPEAASWIGAFGFDACTTASNHSLDQGYDGLVRTADPHALSGGHDHRPEPLGGGP